MSYTPNGDRRKARLAARRVLFLIAAISSFGCAVASACRYSVRDVAFVDLGDSWYRLAFYVDGATSPDALRQGEAAIQDALVDSNVALETIRIGEADKSSLAPIQTLGINSYPSLILIAPDGRPRLITWPTNAQDNPERLGLAAAEVVKSPLRTSVLSQLIRAHSVVLIVESQDQQQNRLAHAAAKQTIDRITAALPDLPKPIDVPPQVSVVSSDVARQESIFLWALGVDRSADHPTQVVVMFGRGRRLGTVVDVSSFRTTSSAEAILGDDARDGTPRGAHHALAEALLGLLAVVGLDCECELDRSWMNAPMIPHAWTSADEAHAAKSLDFDPGHPLVKVEVNQILLRGPSSASERNRVAPDRLLPGLQTIDLDFDELVAKADAADASEITDASEINSQVDVPAVDPPHAPPQPATSVPPPRSLNPALEPEQAQAEPPAATNGSANSRVVSAALGGLALVGVAVAMVIVLYARRNAP